MTTGNVGHPAQYPTGSSETLDEQLRRKGIQPIRSADDLACEEIFETDEELDDFLAFTYAARRAELR